MDPFTIGAIVVGGLVAGVVNTLVGGGTSIVLPLLIALGYDPQLANGTNRFCVAFQAGAAAATFRRHSKQPARQQVPPIVAAIAGAIPGAWLATWLDPTLFREILGWVLLAGVVFFFTSPKKKDAEGTVPATSLPWSGLVACFLFGVYGGFIGAGIGVLILLYLPRLLGLPLVAMVEIKVWMVLALSAAAGVVYLIEGQVSWGIVAALLPSYMVGGVLGAKLTIRGGERWVRGAIATVAAGLAVLIIAGVI